jgi:hypothetical protein
MTHEDLASVQRCLVRNFSTTFKRRLRAGRKRPVLAAEYRGRRVARIPQLAAARPHRAQPGSSIGTGQARTASCRI